MVRLKENAVYWALELYKSFQFLMVRLKEEKQGGYFISTTNFNSLWCD